jgi:hypothetical protein
VAGFESILKAADLIADVRKALTKIEELQDGQRQLANAVETLDRRVREVEAGLREARAEIKLDAVKETQTIVNAVQGQLYGELRSLALTLDRLGREPGASPVIGRSPSDGGDSGSTKTQG